MYKKQFEDDVWACYNFKSLVIAIWNGLKNGKQLKNKGLINDIGEGGDGGIWHL